MIFHSQLPAAVLVTWIQLRCLAWKGWHTPALSIPELASLTGIHPARFQRHLSQLQSISALSIHITGDGKFILSFPEESFVREQNEVKNQNPVTSFLPNSAHTEMPDQSSYFPDQILGYLSYPEEQEQSTIPEHSLNGDAVRVEAETWYLDAQY